MHFLPDSASVLTVFIFSPPEGDKRLEWNPGVISDILRKVTTSNLSKRIKIVDLLAV